MCLLFWPSDYWENPFRPGVSNVPKESQVEERKGLHSGVRQRKIQHLIRIPFERDWNQDPDRWYYTLSWTAKLYLPLVLYLNIYVRTVKMNLGCLSLPLFPTLSHVWSSHWLNLSLSYLLFYLACCWWVDGPHFIKGFQCSIWTTELIPVAPNCLSIRIKPS